MTEILQDLKGRVLTLTLNRPDRANAISLSMSDMLTATFQKAGTNPNIGVILLSGAGKHFCAGGDFSLVKQNLTAARENRDKAFALQEPSHALTRAIESCPKPVIAAVNGAAAGVGLALAVACDIVVSQADTKFLYAYTAIGLPGDAGVTRLLPARIGWARATEMAFFNNPVEAKTALAWGLTNFVAARDQKAIEFGFDLAAQLSAKLGLAIGEIKSLMRVHFHLHDHKFREIESFIKCAQTQETKDMIESMAHKT
jgi:2-(1,2-epoxy-1,2-dihydrophenyl)acetyl-CoA isomerase